MRNLFIFLTVFFFMPIPAFSQTQGAGVIEWQAGRQLTIKDFNVVSDTSQKIHDNNLAVTRTGITYSLKQKQNSGSFEIRLFATVHKSNSYVAQRVLDAPAGSREYLLRHEQRHFDISEIFAREAVKQLATKRFTKNYAKEINILMQSLFKESEAWHDLYDKETRNGRDSDAQRIWDKKIADRLNESEAFKGKVLRKRIY